MNVKILADSRSQREDVSPHLETHKMLGRWLGVGWLKMLSGERGMRFRWVLEVIDTLSTRILEVRLFVTFRPQSLRGLLNQLHLTSRTLT